MGLFLKCALVMFAGRCGATYARASVETGLVGEGTELIESFFACATGVFGVMIETGAFGMVCCGARVVVAGRVAAGFWVDEAREARGVARVGVFSALGREVVEGRFAAVVEGVTVDLLSDGVALPGAALGPAMVLRTAGFLFSSPDVSDASSGSASACAGLLASAVRLAAVPAGARVGGLFRLDPVPARRDVELAGGLDALDGGRVAVFVDAAAGRRAPAEAVVVPLAAAGRRGGTASFFAAEGALEAILRRTTEDGEDGGGSECCWGMAGTLEIFAPALLLAASLAEVLEPSATMLGQLPVRGVPARPRRDQYVGVEMIVERTTNIAYQVLQLRDCWHLSPVPGRC